MLSFVVFIQQCSLSYIHLTDACLILLQAPADLESLYEKSCSELESESVDLSNFTPVLFQKGEVSATATYRNSTGSG